MNDEEFAERIGLVLPVLVLGLALLVAVDAAVYDGDSTGRWFPSLAFAGLTAATSYGVKGAKRLEDGDPDLFGPTFWAGVAACASFTVAGVALRQAGYSGQTIAIMSWMGVLGVAVFTGWTTWKLVGGPTAT